MFINFILLFSNNLVSANTRFGSSKRKRQFNSRFSLLAEPCVQYYRTRLFLPSFTEYYLAILLSLSVAFPFYIPTSECRHISLPLCVVNVSLSRLMTGSGLSSIRITRLHWYYSAIRL